MAPCFAESTPLATFAAEYAFDHNSAVAWELSEKSFRSPQRSHSRLAHSRVLLLFARGRWRSILTRNRMRRAATDDTDAID